MGGPSASQRPSPGIREASCEPHGGDPSGGTFVYGWDGLDLNFGGDAEELDSLDALSMAEQLQNVPSGWEAREPSPRSQDSEAQPRKRSRSEFAAPNDTAASYS